LLRDHLKIVKRQLGPVVLYYVRSAETSNGRVMEKENDRELIKSLQDQLKECGRPERVVFFTGCDADGNELSQEQQYLLFYSATLFVGPHGGALASILFMNVKNVNGRVDRGVGCDAWAQVVEYIAGPRSAHVQWKLASYYGLYFGGPWTEYHLVQFHSNSTSAITFVDMAEWKIVVRAVLAGSRCPKRESRIEMNTDMIDHISRALL